MQSEWEGRLHKADYNSQKKQKQKRRLKKNK